MIFVFDVIDHQYQVKAGWLVGDENHIKGLVFQASLECKTLNSWLDCKDDDVQFFSKWHAFDLSQEWYQSWQETSAWHPNPTVLCGTSYSCENSPLPRDTHRTCCGMWGLWKKVYMGHNPGALAQNSCQPGKNVESWNFQQSYLDAHLIPWCKVPKNPSGE